VSKSDDRYWFDLERLQGTRRDFIRLGAGAASLVALGALPGCTGRSVRFRSNPFALGVGSGDPSPDGVVLWARLAHDALDEVGAGTETVGVRWEVAEDSAFARVVRSGRADALPALGHSVHVEVEGLRPARDYFYRLIAGGEASPVGRTRTTPANGAANDRFDFAFVSCQHYEQGYYTALRHLADEHLDAIVHLGDYIYEGSATNTGVRRHEGPEVRTLEEYRARYTTYRSDADLQAAHLSAPWIVTTDDHEVDNDYAGDHSWEDVSVERFLLRRAAAYQAYYEFMPLRRSSMPSGPGMQLYRRIPLGGLATMHVLDTRQFRSRQPCGNGFAPTCAEQVEPGRTMLGPAQRRWLFDGLAESSARWNVLAQQVLMARFRNRTADGTETWTMDKWDGYPAERQDLLDVMADSGAGNPIVLTGDIHSNWVARLLRNFDDEGSQVVGTEFAGTSLTTGGNGMDQAPIGARALPWNPHFDFYNSQRGYVLGSITQDLWTSTYRRVANVHERGGAVDTLATFVVENGIPGAQRG
jgi:alkaline phosphatase D